MSDFVGKDGLLHNRTLPYPSIVEVQNATRLQCARWYRFCASPGLCAIGKNRKEFNLIADEEKTILNAIIERFEVLGGWDSNLSKLVGWTL
jgi:hypothetical protein